MKCGDLSPSNVYDIQSFNEVFCVMSNWNEVTHFEERSVIDLSLKMEPVILMGHVT